MKCIKCDGEDVDFIEDDNKLYETEYNEYFECLDCGAQLKRRVTIIQGELTEDN